jgi:hypothetical protein
MPRRAKGLTAAFVEKVTKPGRYGDGGNLYLEVKSRHVKSYSFIYTSPLTAKCTELGLGPCARAQCGQARPGAGDGDIGACGRPGRP